MSERKRNEQGRYTETITPERVLDTLADAEEPFMATGDIAEVLGCSNEAARLKLNRLYEEERVDRRNVRGAVVVWWLPEDTDKAGAE
jgi:predicted ArsR family transcriptional regulator